MRVIYILRGAIIKICDNDKQRAIQLVEQNPEVLKSSHVEQVYAALLDAGGSKRERCVFAHLINEHVVTFQYVQVVADEHAKHVSGVFSSR